MVRNDLNIGLISILFKRFFPAGKRSCFFFSHQIVKYLKYIKRNHINSNQFTSGDRCADGGEIIALKLKLIFIWLINKNLLKSYPGRMLLLWLMLMMMMVVLGESFCHSSEITCVSSFMFLMAFARFKFIKNCCNDFYVNFF